MDLIRFLEAFRAKDGFTRAELAEIERAFRRYDRDCTGAVSTTDVGKVLRWFGYPTSWETQQNLVAEVGASSSGLLNLAALRKIVWKFQLLEVMRMRALVDSHDIDGFRLLSPNDCRSALHSLRRTMGEAGHAVGEIEVDAVFGATASDEDEDDCGPSGSKGVDLCTFLEHANRLRSLARAGFQDNAGFSAEEVEEMRGRFATYDTDGSGDIDNTELRKLLEEVFLKLSTSSRLRPQLLKLLQEVDADTSGRLDFADFLRLMRQLHDLENLQSRHDEEQAIMQTLFTQTEVEEFRTLFLRAERTEEEAADGGRRRQLSLARFREMIGTICPLGESHVAELMAVLRETLGLCEGHVGLEAGMDFPEFLLLMRRLLDDNFANIKEHTQKAAQLPEKEFASMKKRRSTLVPLYEERLR